MEFTGRVQGVGFRWKAAQLAKQYGLPGWVRNNEDGSVSMEIQGENMAIFVLLDKLKNDPWIIVENYRADTIPVVKNEPGFRVISQWEEFE